MWNALAKLQKSSVDKIPVVFNNVQFLKTTPIPEDGKSTKIKSFSWFNNKLQWFFDLGKLNLIINILEATGEFRVRENDSILVSGFIKIQTADEQLQLPELKSYEVDHLSTADIYQDLTFKGYKYSKSFQGINLASNNGIYYLSAHRTVKLI